MPNWTDCHLTVSGPPMELARFVAVIQPEEDGPISVLGNAFPMPPEYLHTVNGSHPIRAKDGWDWYVWCAHNWGTKWPDDDADLCYESQLRDGPPLLDLVNECRSRQWMSRTQVNASPFDAITLSFQTAWCAPIPGITEIASRWNLRFEMTWLDEGDGQYDAETDEWLPGDGEWMAWNEDLEDESKEQQ